MIVILEDKVFELFAPILNTIAIDTIDYHADAGDFVSFNELQYSLGSRVRYAIVIGVDDEFVEVALLAVYLDVDFLLLIVFKWQFK